MSDELLGFWENGVDDRSGLHAIWGYGMEFLEGGEGIDHNWHPHIKLEERRQKIHWRREGEKRIAVKFAVEDEWDEIEYEIIVYDRVWLRLTEKGKEEFWCAPEPLYKRI